MAFDKAYLDGLLKNRKRGIFASRPFLGLADDQRVVLKDVFPGSSVVISSPVDVFDSWPAIVLEGPEFQINFLRKQLSPIVKNSASEESGFWSNILQTSAEKIEMFFNYGRYPWERLLLIEDVFRRDAMLCADLKLEKSSKIEVVYNNKQVLATSVVLPKEVANGNVELPRIAFLQ
ncbi:MAG: hypothetical protein Q8Q46_01730 [Candidatus Giovannonibacteria bacterium]|nr:hypothetical protein [Candidatus Giovannonibacteria bacterium]